MVPSLHLISYRSVVKNFDSYITKCPDCINPKYVWRFAESDICLLPQVAQKLLLDLVKHERLKEEHLNLFSSQYTYLETVFLPNMSLNPRSVCFMRGFDLLHLSVVNLSGINLNDLIDNLSEGTFESLKMFDITNISIKKNKKNSALKALSRLVNLQSLNVSRTCFDNNCLRYLSTRLTQLRRLNLSETKVDSIDCLLPLKKIINELILHRLKFHCHLTLRKMLLNVMELEELRVLDISNTDLYTSRFSAVDRLCSADVLPHLTSLDISGNQFSLTSSDVKKFIETHPHLSFLGVADWRPQENSLELSQFSTLYPGIEMTGDIGEKQLLASLEKYKNRPVLLQNSLRKISFALRHNEHFSHQVLKATLNTIEMHQNDQSTMLFGIIAVRYLLNQVNTAEIPFRFILHSLKVTLEAMYAYTDDAVIYNCGLTLLVLIFVHDVDISNKQLLNILFHRFLHLECIEIGHLNHKLFEYVFSKLSRRETYEIISDQFFWQCLTEFLSGNSTYKHSAKNLRVLQKSLDFPVFTIAHFMKASVAFCENFISSGGLTILSRIVEKTEGEYKSILKVLREISKHPLARLELYDEPWLSYLSGHLKHNFKYKNNIVGEIVCNMACIHRNVWGPSLNYSKDSFLYTLGKKICRNKSLDPSPYDSKSFSHLESLIFHRDTSLVVQLWSLWRVLGYLKGDRFRVYSLNMHENLKRFLLYVTSSDVESLTNSYPTVKACLEASPLIGTVNESGAVLCGSLEIPQSWRTLCCITSTSLNANQTVTNYKLTKWSRFKSKRNFANRLKEMGKEILEIVRTFENENP